MINNLKRANDFAPLMQQPLTGFSTNLKSYDSIQLHHNARADVSSINIYNLRKSLRNKFLLALDEAEFARLIPHFEIVMLKAGEEIYEAGDFADDIYFPEDAVFSQMQILKDGRTTEFGIIDNQGIVGSNTLFGLQPQMYWTQVVIGGTALKVKAGHLNFENNQNNAFQRNLLNFVHLQMAQISQRTVCSMHHMVGERFCSWLLMLFDRCKSQSLMLTQDQIANHLGVHRPSVTHIAKILRDKNIIGYTRGRINLINRVKLEKSACECYEVSKEFTVSCGNPLSPAGDYNPAVKNYIV